MKKIRCNLAYHKMKVNDFPIFATGVRDGLYSNPTQFATPPMTQADLQAVIDTYNNTRAAYENGGSAQKGPYQAAKAALTDTLDVLAEYVDSVADGNENIILLSGFKPTKSSPSEIPAPTQLTMVTLTRGASGELFAECETQSGAVWYGAILTSGEPIPVNVQIDGSGQLVLVGDEPATASATVASATANPTNVVFDFNTSRKKRFKGLLPGATYYLTMFASNASGVGSLSFSVSAMCV